jgi:hypothetical protein
MLGWIIVIVCVVLLLAMLFWNKVKTLLPTAWQNSSVVASASDVVTDATTSFSTLAVAGWANDDTTFLVKLSECRALQKKWGETSAASASTPTVESLAKELADLKAKAAESTTTPAT